MPCPTTLQQQGQVLSSVFQWKLLTVSGRTHDQASITNHYNCPLTFAAQSLMLLLAQMALLFWKRYYQAGVKWMGWWTAQRWDLVPKCLGAALNGKKNIKFYIYLLPVFVWQKMSLQAEKSNSRTSNCRTNFLWTEKVVFYIKKKLLYCLL